MSAAATPDLVGTRCDCGHGAGYHDGRDGTPAVTQGSPINPPAGRCHHTDCSCTAWVLDPVGEPGVYQMTAEEYHADPVEGGSLSSSGARALLPPSCPARFRWERDQPPDPKAHYDIGHAAHRLVLGVGPELVAVDYENWRTNAAKAAAEEARLAGAVPLLAADHQMVHDMAAALRAHPFAGKLFDPDRGDAEATIVWRDERTGVWRRARLDWLPHPGPGRMVIPDFKTAHSVDPDALSKAMQSYGYHLQADWNRAGCQALGLAGPDAEFVLVAQEKVPPYLVTVFQPDHVAMRIGQLRNAIALDVFTRCQETGEWPGYVDDVCYLPLPRWAETEWEGML